MKKTQKSFRKKALLSSLSMLMVATVAVGSATFAWFTSNTTTTAKGINVKTVKASELQVSKSDHAWGDNITYGIANKVLIPASTADGSSWWTTSAASKTASTKVDGDFSSATAPAMGNVNSSNYAIAQQLNVKNIGDADINNVRITWTMPTNKYVRIALVEADDTGAITGTFTDSVFDADGVAYEAASGAAATTEITPTTTGSVTVNLGDDNVLSKNEAVYYNLYVWFEGQDVDCYDTNAGQEVPDIEFSVSGDTVVSTAG